LNRALVDDTEDGRFVTMMMVRLDLATRSLDYISAGHTPALLLDKTGDLIDTLRSTNPPLGIVHDIRFESLPSKRLEPGGLLLLMTDGLIEAQSPSEEVFGENRVLDLLRANRSLNSTEIVDGFRGAIHTFIEGESLQDDVTVVAIKGLGPQLGTMDS
jgi:phosphoserine phosphatase RsbU/P